MRTIVRLLAEAVAVILVSAGRALLDAGQNLDERIGSADLGVDADRAVGGWVDPLL